MIRLIHGTAAQYTKDYDKHEEKGCFFTFIFFEILFRWIRNIISRSAKVIVSEQVPRRNNLKSDRKRESAEE
jgi:hypothetical protein